MCRMNTCVRMFPCVWKGASSRWQLEGRERERERENEEVEELVARRVGRKDGGRGGELISESNARQGEEEEK